MYRFSVLAPFIRTANTNFAHYYSTETKNVKFHDINGQFVLFLKPATYILMHKMKHTGDNKEEKVDANLVI